VTDNDGNRFHGSTPKSRRRYSHDSTGHAARTGGRVASSQQGGSFEKEEVSAAIQSARDFSYLAYRQQERSRREQSGLSASWQADMRRRCWWAVNQINRIISAAVVRQIAHSCDPAVENIQQALRKSLAVQGLLL
jgi:hypothetical protein